MPNRPGDAGHAGTVRGEVFARGAPTGSYAGPPPRGSRVGRLLRLARRLGGRARRPVAVTAAVAVPAVRAVALTSPLGRIVADQRATRPVVALRAEGCDVPVSPATLARLHPHGSGRLLVLVPGSGEDERIWHRGEEHTGATYADRLAALLGWSPVLLRHDAGTDPADAAPALGALLQRVVDDWPVPVSRIAILAHGDGGLLARGALGLRVAAPRPWTALVTELVALGTPSLGTDREPASRALGRTLDRELAGIVVAGPGLLDVAPPDHVDYLLVGDRLTSRPHPLGLALGGLLRPWQRSRRVHDLFPTAERFELPADRHPLVNHPAVHDALLRWLA